MRGEGSREQLGQIQLAETNLLLLLCVVKRSFPPLARLKNVQTNCWVTDEGEGNHFLLSAEQKDLGKQHPKHKHLFSIWSCRCNETAALHNRSRE